MHTSLNREKKSPKNLGYFFYFQKNNNPIGENSPDLVTLKAWQRTAGKSNLKSAFFPGNRFVALLCETNLKGLPWRRGTMYIASASGTEDPGSNPAKV
jgi:hypothetical protein